MGDFRKATSNSNDALKYVGKKFEKSGNNAKRQELIDNLFSNPQTVGGNKLYGFYETPEELTQTAKVVDRLNAKSACCPNKEQGIEGLIYKQNGEIVPFSLKNLSTDSPHNAVNKIIENQKQIIGGVGEDLFGGVVKTGSNPNTIIDIEIKNISKQSMTNYLNSYPDKLNFSTATYSEFYFECKDGEILKLNKYGKIIN